MVRLQNEPIDPAKIEAAVRSDADGAVASFVGFVREENLGRRVLRIEYHAYPEMARRQMELLADELRGEFGTGRVAIVHRLGSLEVGEASVAIAVAAPHRREALAACAAAIDRLKLRVPVWKKEFFEGGSVWIEGCRHL
jgi:molybdopterin synthase catalytic subunit